MLGIRARARAWDDRVLFFIVSFQMFVFFSCRLGILESEIEQSNSESEKTVSSCIP